MNSEKLMDAIGMVDDRFLADEKKGRLVPFRRKLIALIAAVVVLSLSLGSVMAATQEFPQLNEQIEKIGENIQQMLFPIFHIETHEKPPEGSVPVTLPSATDGTEPSGPVLEQIDVVNIDGAVNAHYFAGEGYIQRFEGGFYTYSGWEGDVPPEKYAFWEIRKEGIVDADARRVEFTLVYDGREFQIIFDYAIINGKLCIMVWPKGLNENPWRNGWNVQAIGDRTDVALMNVPVQTEGDITNDYFLLNMETLETTPLLENISTDNMIIDWCDVTENLNYAMLTGIDRKEGIYKDWFCDLRQNTITHIDDLTGFITPTSYFLDDSTLICEQWLGDGFINMVRHDIPTGEQTVVVENVKRVSASGGYMTIGKAFGMLYAADGSADLIDLRTGKVTALTGVDLQGTTVKESPNGKNILIAYSEWAKDEKTSKCYPKLGLLDPEKEEMKLLIRDISGNAENLRGWLDDETIVITTRNSDESYYVLLYEFIE